jgi:hypothetical protein
MMNDDMGESKNMKGFENHNRYEDIDEDIEA